MDVITRILFGSRKGVNVLGHDWDHLIVLDACRCDIFERVYRRVFPKAAEFKCIMSSASSTAEFIKRNLMDHMNNYLREKLRNTILVNSKPVIDHILSTKLRELFYDYVPVWRSYWDYSIGVVKPEDVYRVTLKVYVRHPDKKMIVWFLQPHYPYLSRRFVYVSIVNRAFMNRWPLIAQHHKAFDNNLLWLFKIIGGLLKKGCLYDGIPDKVVHEYALQKPSEIVKAYVINLFLVLQYVKKLSEILPGKIVITSDHGEAFGEKLHRWIPLRVYGHMSRIRTRSLTQVPYLIVENNITQHEAVRRALKYPVHLFITQIKDRKMQGPRNTSPHIGSYGDL